MGEKDKTRVGVIYRYGVVDHMELYPIIPDFLQELGLRAEVYYIGPNSGKIRECDRYSGVQYVAIPFSVSRKSFNDKILKALLWYFYLPFIALYCRLKRLDIIWIDENLPMQVRIVQLISGCRVAQTVVDFFVDIYKDSSIFLRVASGVLAKIDRKSWEKSAGIFTRTDAMRSYLMESGIQCEVRTERDAVKPDLFMPVDASRLRKELNYSEHDVVLCHHGILHPNKGIPLLLDYLADYFPKHPELKLLIIGDGPAYNEVKASVIKHGIEDRVIMTGWLSSHAAVNEYLCAADIGLVMRLATFYDHFHVTGACVHCMMAQLPVLSVNLRGVMEVIQDETEGYIFDPNDKSSLFRQLTRLIENKEARLKMGIKGRQKALQLFNPKRIAIETVESLLNWSKT